MSNRKYVILLIVISVIGLILTGIHLFYIYNAYTNSSIIHFISEEVW